MSAQLDCDVVIVGAGVSGALLAWRLGSAGVKVIVLDSGPGPLALANRQAYVDNYKVSGLPYPINNQAPKEDDFLAATTNYFDFEHPGVRPNQGKVVPGDAVPGDPFASFNVINKVTAEGDWFQSNYERQSGGSTWHWLGTSLRLLPNDFRLASTYGPSIGGLKAYDWPFGYSDIEPWYGLAEQTIGVSGPDTGEDYLGITRSTNYPMPGIPQSYLDQQFVAALNGQSFADGWVNQSFPLSVSPTPQARNSAPGYGGRPQCQGSTSCIPICPIQAKYDATQHVALAQHTGNVQFRNYSVAVQVLVNTSDPALPITGIQYKTWQPNSPTVTAGTVTGKVYVLAAHAVENAKLLLLSPCGTITVANQSDQVGRNLADHPVSLVYGLTDRPVYGYRGPLSTSGVESLRDGAFRKFRGAFRMEIGNDGWTWPINDPYTTPQNLLNEGLTGSDLATAVSNTLTRQTRIGCLAEQLPNPNFRVMLSETLKDGLGIPRPALTYGIDPYGQCSLSAAVAASVQIFNRLIAKPVVQYNYTDWSTQNIVTDWKRSDRGTPNIFVREGWAGAGHLMGTHRMGSDPATSVVDGTQKAHGHPNLYLLGSGNWPSYATANPTLTIAALALWAADTIKKRLTQ
jgi:choline dehydrogenase-like flavoprotein